MNTQQFASLLKSKNPKWSAIDDETLVTSVLNRYPSYRERIDGLSEVEQPRQEEIEKPGFLSRSGTALKERFGEVKKTFGETARGEISPVETGVRVVGDVAGSVGDVVGAAISPQIEKLAQKEWAKPAFEALAGGMEKYEDWKNSSELNRRSAEVIESVVNIADLVGMTAGAKATAKATSKVAGKVATRVFDTTKSLPERLRAIRSSLPTKPTEMVAGVAEQADVVTKPTIIQRFTENPSITGALDDIKIIVGLPENTPSVDLTFRAIKPRLTKKVNLRRVKAQMQLANKTIVEEGFKPVDIKSYADAIYETKKKVWGQIESKLEAGQLAGKQVDIVPMAVKILDRASDPALLRTNPVAAKQLTEMAENLVKYGDNIDILEAERMKQLLNAELEGAFGDLDLSKHAKEAKKYLTSELGKQLDEILSELPGDFKDLKIKYGSLSAIEDDVLKRAIVFERANPEGLADMLTKTQAAAELVFGNMKSRAQAIARLTMQKRLKKANDVNDMIKRAFDKIESPSFNPPAVGQTVKPKTVDPLIQEAKKVDVSKIEIKQSATNKLVTRQQKYFSEMTDLEKKSYLSFKKKASFDSNPFAERFNKVNEKYNLEVYKPQFKSDGRAIEKAIEDYKRDFSRISDMNRGAFIVDNLDNVDAIVKDINSTFVVKKVNNRFVNETLGYRDVLVKVNLPNGTVGEIQIIPKEIAKAKDATHLLYEESRTLLSQSKIRKLTPAEKQRMVVLELKQRKAYNSAWENYKENFEINKSKMYGMEKSKNAPLQQAFGEIKGKELEGIVAKINEGGITYDMLKKVPRANEPLFSVSIYPENTKLIDVGKLKTQDIYEFVRKNRKMLDKPNHFLGGWLDTESGKIFLDVSVSVKDKSKAIQLGKEFNQKSVYDLMNFKEINTGGTGESLAGTNIVPRIQSSKKL
uniref:RelA/SpoT domain-containing protein n=1 Tax=viral metagenome TaxID=1070528 RepID=A0A6H1ZS43_9ZZZZ